MLTKKWLAGMAFYLCFSIFLLFDVFGQPVYQWANKIGDTNFDFAEIQMTDGAGNVYVTGQFQSTVDFDPSAGVANLTATGIGGDLYLAKYNAAGQYQWARRFGGTGSSTVIPGMLSFEPGGNIILAGYYLGTVDFNPNPGVTTNFSSIYATNDIFIVKLTNNGNYVWAKSIGGEQDDMVLTGCVDNSGNIYVGGTIGSDADVDPSAAVVTQTTITYEDIFFGKYDTNGNYVWAKNFGSSGYFEMDPVMDMHINSSGNLVLAGNYKGTVDFDPSAGVTSLTAPTAYSYIGQYSTTSGSFISVKDIRGPSLIRDLMLDNAGDILICGGYTGTVDFDPSASVANLTHSGAGDAFLAKYDAAGNYLWAFKIGGTSVEELGKVVMDNSSYYVTGVFAGTVDFDPSAATANLTSAGMRDIFLAKYEFSGNYVWATKIGSSLDEYNRNLHFQGGNIYISGSFRNTVDFDPGTGVANLSPSGNDEAFVAKYFLCTPPAVAGTITGNIAPCINVEYTYSISAVPGATTYAWVVPANAIIVSGQGTTSIVVKFTSVASGAIMVAAHNSCSYSGLSLKTITPLEAPISSSSITGPTPVCAGSIQTYSTPAVTGASSYTWTVPSGATIISGQGTTSISVQFGNTGGNVTVTPGNICGTATPYSKFVTVNYVAPARPIVGPFSAQQGTTGLVYSIALVSGATSYTWSVPPGSTIVSGQGTISITVTAGSISGDITVTPVGGSGGACLGTSKSHYLNIFSCPNFLNYESVNKVEGSFSVGQQVKTDASGNVFVLGAFNGTIDLDFGAGVYNLTSSGNIYVTGYFKGTVDFDITIAVNSLTSASTPSGNSWDAFVVKYNSTGAVYWATPINVDIHDHPTGLALDASGNIFVTGNNLGYSYASGSIFLSKLNNSGVVQWTNTFVGGSEFPSLSGHPITSSVAVDNTGNAYITNNFYGTIDFDPSAAVFNLGSTSANIVVAKYSTAGALVFAKALGGAGKDVGYGITTDASNFYITGLFSGTADFDPSPNTSNLVCLGGTDIYLAKYDLSGNFVWAKSFGSTSSQEEMGFDITVDAIGNIYTAGHFYNTADFDPSSSTANLVAPGISNNVYIAKYSSTGNYLWAKGIIGSGSFDQPIVYDIHLAGSTLYVTGNFFGTVDFDPSSNTANLVSSVSGPEAFLAKYSECLSSGSRIAVGENMGTEITEISHNNSGWSIYPNPGNEEVFLNALSIEEAEYELCELSGTVLSKGSLKSGIKSISTIHLSSGTYLVKVGNKNTGFTYKKLVVVH